MRYDRPVNYIRAGMEGIFGATHSLILSDSFQLDDYSQYATTGFDPAEKARSRESQFTIE